VAKKPSQGKNNDKNVIPFDEDKVRHDEMTHNLVSNRAKTIISKGMMSNGPCISRDTFGELISK
jgi:hypothetical protein